MRLLKGFRPAILALFALFPALAFSGVSRVFQDFAFIHAADVHAPSKASGLVIDEIGRSGVLELTPYKVKAGPPAFVIVSGDLTEFGGGDGVWSEYMSYWKNVPFPVYHQLGNHDGPWFSNRPYLRELYGACSWAFDRFGFHFIGLDTSTPHDPRANITQEQFAWLKSDLAKLKPETPVFLTLHHPLNDTYFGSPYAVARLLDLLRPYNLVAVLIGHGHRASSNTWFGVDNIQGGSTTGPAPALAPGFSVVSVQNGMLRVAHKLFGESAADHPVLEKPIPARSSYPQIEILSPAENDVYKGEPLIIKARISGGEKPMVSASWLADNTVFDEQKWIGSPMVCSGGVCEAEADYAGWVQGQHNVQVVFTDEAGVKYTKSVRFGTEPEPGRLLWRTFLGGSCKGAATAAGDTVYVGATDTKLYALDLATGKVKWSYRTGGDVSGKPLVVGDTVYFGSGDGRFYAVTSKGKLRWKFRAKEGIYSSPVFADGLVLFGSDDSGFYAVNAKNGKLAWVSEEPGYSIEVKPFVEAGAVYFGAWDQYLYALDVKTGALKWRSNSAGSSGGKPGVRRYLSPADCGPVVSGGRVFVADRNSQLSVIDSASGVIISSGSDCVAVGLSEDGKAVYKRGPESGLSKVGLDDGRLWTAPAELDAVPAPPVEKDGAVYAVSRLGLVQAFNASDGAFLWKYQATPLLYVLSEVEAAGGAVYVTGMDGSVTALKAKLD